MSTIKKVDDKEMMADVASVILLLEVSKERLKTQQNEKSGRASGEIWD